MICAQPSVEPDAAQWVTHFTKVSAKSEILLSPTQVAVRRTLLQSYFQEFVRCRLPVLRCRRSVSAEVGRQWEELGVGSNDVKQSRCVIHFGTHGDNLAPEAEARRQWQESGTGRTFAAIKP